MGRSERTKGANFERKVARWLRETLKLGDFQRVLEETQQGNVGDVRDRSSRFPLVIQAKHRNVVNEVQALREAEAACTKPWEIPIAFCRVTGGEDVVAMRPRDFAWLVTTLSAYVEGSGGDLMTGAMEMHGKREGW